jgi:hypothetical protein
MLTWNRKIVASHTRKSWRGSFEVLPPLERIADFLSWSLKIVAELIARNLSRRVNEIVEIKHVLLALRLVYEKQSKTHISLLIRIASSGNSFPILGPSTRRPVIFFANAITVKVFVKLLA